MRADYLNYIYSILLDLSSVRKLKFMAQNFNRLEIHGKLQFTSFLRIVFYFEIVLLCTQPHLFTLKNCFCSCFLSRFLIVNYAFQLSLVLFKTNNVASFP